MLKKIKSYIKSFNSNVLLEKIPSYVKLLGLKTVYSVLLLFNAYRRKETPPWAKNVILGTLGYLISPIDSIPDLTPVIGYTDDLGVLSFGLVTIACYINEDIREASKEQLSKWFGTFDNKALETIDSKL